MIQNPLIAIALLSTLATQSPKTAEGAAYQSCVESAPRGGERGFKLRHDYPKNRPMPMGGKLPWQTIGFPRSPGEYARSLLEAARAGLESVRWDASEQRNTPHWFHAPWMASGPEWDRGREYFHGLQPEPSVTQAELSKGGLASRRNRVFSIEYYNDVAAWTLQRIFGSDVSHPNYRDVPFDDGAMMVKLLFTDAPEAEAPSLKGTLEWTCDAYNASAKKRVPILVRLFRVDIAVRDSGRGAPGAWWFESFGYNGSLPGSKVFDRLELATPNRNANSDGPFAWFELPPTYPSAMAEPLSNAAAWAKAHTSPEPARILRKAHHAG